MKCRHNATKNKRLPYRVEGRGSPKSRQKPNKQTKGTTSADFCTWKVGEVVKKSENFADIIHGSPPNLKALRSLLIQFIHSRDCSVDANAMRDL